MLRLVIIKIKTILNLTFSTKSSLYLDLTLLQQKKIIAITSCNKNFCCNKFPKLFLPYLLKQTNCCNKL